MRLMDGHDFTGRPRRKCNCTSPSVPPALRRSSSEGSVDLYPGGRRRKCGSHSFRRGGAADPLRFFDLVVGAGIGAYVVREAFEIIGEARKAKQAAD